MSAATKRHNNIATVKRSVPVLSSIFYQAEYYRRDGAMVALLTGVVVVLVVCHTPKTFINLFESYHMLRYGKMTAEPLWSKIVIKLSHLLLSLSSAVNIIIY